jgi:hypothetical protein
MHCHSMARCAPMLLRRPALERAAACWLVPAAPAHWAACHGLPAVAHVGAECPGCVRWCCVQMGAGSQTWWVTAAMYGLGLGPLAGPVASS